MKAKIEIAVEPELLRRIRSLTAKEGKGLDELISQTLSEYWTRKSSASVVAPTAGNRKLSKDEVDRILHDEPGIFDDDDDVN